jgi:coiled-coil domain-containing protein 12
MSLEKQAASRKERLAQLRNLKRKNEATELGVTAENAEEETVPKVGGRNFDVDNRAPKLGFLEKPLDGLDETVELVAERVKKETIDKFSVTASGPLDLTSLQPKSVTWDLKRDIEPKLKMLETRTDNAIIRLVRERLQESGKRATD